MVPIIKGSNPFFSKILELNCKKVEFIMYLNILCLPLLGSIFAGIGGKFLGSKGSGLVSTLV